MKEQAFKAMVTSYLTGELSDEGKALLLDACRESAERQKFFEDAEKIWVMTGDEPEIIVPDVSEQWEVFSEKNLGPSANKDGKVVPIRSRLMRIAAAVLLLLASVATWYLVATDVPSSEQIIVRADSNLRELELPDGSRVWLHEGSRLSYHVPFEQRVVTLSGKALFEVTHTEDDDRFVVDAGESQVTVLGTTFMVDASHVENVVDVYVQEGRVKVDGAGKEETLIKGERITYRVDRAQFEKTMGDNSNILSWKTGHFIFADSPLQSVIPQLEAHYNVKINVANEGMLTCTWRTDFENLSIELVLQELAFGLNMEVSETAANTYLLSGSACL